MEREDACEIDAIADGSLQQEVLGELALGRIGAFHFSDLFDQKTQCGFDHRLIKAGAAHGGRERDITDLTHQSGGQRGGGA